MVKIYFSVLAVSAAAAWAFFALIASAMGDGGSDISRLIIFLGFGILPLMIVTGLASKMRGNSWVRITVETLAVVIVFFGFIAALVAVGF